MGTKPPSPRAIAFALLFVLSCFGFMLLVWSRFGGSVLFQAKGYRVHALLGLDAVNLADNAQVRIAGVKVGHVAKTTVEHGRVDADIQMDPGYAPVPQDVRLIVRTKTLIGETFLEMSPGSRTAPKVADGGALPAAAAVRSVGIDEVLGQFDAPTRQSFKELVTNISAALHGRGEDINAFFGNVGPGLDDFNKVVTILDAQRPKVQRLIDNAGVALNAMSARGGELRSLATAGDRVLATTSARNRALTDTVHELPPFLHTLRGSLSALATTADAAAPTLRILSPVAPLLKPSLDGTNRMAPELAAVFRGLRPLGRASKSGLPALTRIGDKVRPLLDTLDPAGRDVVPFLQMFTAYSDELVRGFANVGAATQYTTTGRAGQRLNVLRILAPVTNEILTGYATRPGSNRHNAFLAPGGLEKLISGGLEAYDCRNTSNSTPVSVIGTGAPACRQQAPWTFQGHARSFPHTERAG